MKGSYLNDPCRDQRGGEYDECEHEVPTAYDCVECLKFELNRISDELSAREADIEEAAGEFLVDLPEPGTPIAKVLSANVLLRRENEQLREIARQWPRLDPPPETSGDLEAVLDYIDSGLCRALAAPEATEMEEIVHDVIVYVQACLTQICNA